MKSASNPLLPVNATVLWNIVFWMTMLVYAAGLFVTIMEPDAAVYAEVSMEMHDSGNFLSIMHKGADWLDKPSFPFWMSAISYSIFGVSAFAYKLPAVIFILLASVYTFLFGKKFYSALHGWIAVIILITAQHIIISNQDVRAEPFMTGLVIMALYHFAVFLGYKDAGKYNWVHVIAGSLALACLMMTKGLFTIIPVGAGIGLALLYKKNWKEIVHWQWLMVGVLIIIFLSPALYGYYQQFDLHPEKEVFGEKHVSGVKFFLWTSQWGRFTNTGPIKGKGDLFYFVHTMLWAFLPWAFAAFFALYQKTKQLIKNMKSAPSVDQGTSLLDQRSPSFDQGPPSSQPEWEHEQSVSPPSVDQGTPSSRAELEHEQSVSPPSSRLWRDFGGQGGRDEQNNRVGRGENYTYFGFIVLFLIFSFSKFQLSFYLNPLFPLLAIITTAALLNTGIKTLRTFSIIHMVLCCLLVVALIALNQFFLNSLPHFDTVIIVLMGGGLAGYLFTRRGKYLKKILFATAMVCLSVNYYVNRDFYPALLHYQAESEVAYYMKDNNIPAGQVVFVGPVESVADIILHHVAKVVDYDTVETAEVSGKYVFTSPEGRHKIDSMAIPYTVIKEFEDFPVTRLTGKFINRKTRSKELEQKFLLKLQEVDITKPVVETTSIFPGK